MALENPLVLEECADGIRRCHTFVEPGADLLLVQLNDRRVFDRIEIAHLLDEPSVTWREGVCYDHPVERLLFGALPS